jgi:hypothetical protein
MFIVEDVVGMQRQAQSIKPNLQLYVSPVRPQIEKGPDAIVEYLLEYAPRMVHQTVAVLKAQSTTHHIILISNEKGS